MSHVSLSNSFRISLGDPDILDAIVTYILKRKLKLLWSWLPSDFIIQINKQGEFGGFVLFCVK